jgi:hypothetical protein
VRSTDCCYAVPAAYVAGCRGTLRNVRWSFNLELLISQASGGVATSNGCASMHRLCTVSCIYCNGHLHKTRKVVVELMALASATRRASVTPSFGVCNCGLQCLALQRALAQNAKSCGGADGTRVRYPSRFCHFAVWGSATLDYDKQALQYVPA